MMMTSKRDVARPGARRLGHSHLRAAAAAARQLEDKPVSGHQVSVTRPWKDPDANLS